MKKQFIVLLSSILVALLCVTGVYAADDLSGYFYLYGNSSSTLTFYDGGFSLVPDGTSNNISAKVSSDISSISGSVSFTLSKGGNASKYICFTGNSYLENVTFSNTVGCTVSENGRMIYPVAGTTAGSFDFSVSYSTANNNFEFASNNSSVASPTSADYVFTSLTIDGADIVGGVTGEVVDFSIPAGYALVIDGPCEIVERSYYINNSWDFTKNGNMRVNGAFENDLSSIYIRDGYSPDLAYTRDDLIQWEALNPNLLGTASNYESYNGSLVTITQGQTYVIGYPQLYGFGSSNSRLLYTNSVDLIGHVYLNYTDRPSFRYIAIESLSEFTNTGDFYTYSVFRPEVADVTGDVTSGSGGVVVTPSTPLPSGGGNAGQPPVDEDGSLLGTISRFVNDIKRLLSSAVEAINTLVNDGTSFMQSIGAMFSWLPAPLVSLIIAGFTVLLVVGVLKVLWR